MEKAKLHLKGLQSESEYIFLKFNTKDHSDYDIYEYLKSDICSLEIQDIEDQDTCDFPIKIRHCRKAIRNKK